MKHEKLMKTWNQKVLRPNAPILQKSAKRNIVRHTEKNLRNYSRFWKGLILESRSDFSVYE